MIRFHNVGLSYNQHDTVLHNVSFELNAGSYHFLSGPSGSGKSTLMQLLYMGLMPTSGKIEVFGRDIRNLDRDSRSRIRQKIGVIFQDFKLLDHLTVYENVSLPLRLADIDSSIIRNNVLEILDWVGLGDFVHALPSTLSGGQKQRVAIARAVINQPDILLADEPTGSLDEEIGFRLMTLFEQLNKMGTTIVIATHSLSIMQKFKHPRFVLSNKSLNIEDPMPLIQYKTKPAAGSVF
jgi:cell division transport system ATP-binding protein